LPPIERRPTFDVWYILYLEKNFPVNREKISSESGARRSKPGPCCN
jgi:hypothetical protein